VSVLSSREWATVFWLVVLLGFVLTKPDLRRSMVGVLRAMLAWKLLTTVAVVALWLSLLVMAGRSVGLWNSGLWKDTVVWFVASGLVLGFAALRAMEEGAFFRDELRKLAGATVVLQFLMNLYTLNFFIEVILQGVLALLFAVSVYAAHHGEHAQTKRLVDGVLGVIWIAVLFATIWGTVRTWREIDASQKLLEFAFSVWVPFFMLPLVYGVALVMVYEQSFMRMGFRAKGSVALSTKAGVVLGTRANLATARVLSRSPGALAALVEASTSHERKDVLAKLRASASR
jgi:hypothetical protein